MKRTYKTFKEKEQDYNCTRIDKLVELTKCIDELNKKKSFRFRGVSEAKYLMFTSLQRHLPNWSNHKEYILELLANVKKNKKIQKYFEDKNISINDLSCLSLMQHLGLPTPFLDFTIDVKIALSFAADSSDAEKTEDKMTICDYCSLYYFDLKKENEINYNIQKVLKTGIDGGVNLCEEYRKTHPYENLDDSSLRKINEYINWKQLEKIEIGYIENQEISPIVITFNNEILDINNPNIMKQKGAFLINQYKNEMPLNENWNMRTSKRRSESMKGIKDGIHENSFTGIQTKKKMHCVNIKKSVILEWSKKNQISVYDKSIRDLQQSLESILDDYNKIKKMTLKKTLIQNSNTNSKGYFNSYEDNIYTPEMPLEHKLMFSGGSGQELENKAKAVHSSSMLAYNFFSWININNPLVYDEITYDKVIFEKKLRTLSNSPSPANLDICLISNDSKNILFIESKFTEHFANTAFKISNSYKDKTKNLAQINWSPLIKEYFNKTGKYYEGIKQNICHLVALNNFASKLDNQKYTVKYINLIFDPSDYFTKENEQYINYRTLVNDFIKNYQKLIEHPFVNDISFVSYSELWLQIESCIKDQKLKDFLHNRYLQYSQLSK